MVPLKNRFDSSGGFGRLTHPPAAAPISSWHGLNLNSPPLMPVEVILKTKIEGLGSEADIVSVKPGYARNFLIPKDFAAPATNATKRQVEELRRKRAEREASELNSAQELAGKLGKLKLVFTLEA